MIYNTKMASITKLRQNATMLLKEVAETHEPIFILQNSEKKAVIIDGETFEELMEAYQNQKDYQIAEAAFHDKKGKIYTLKEIEANRSKK